jgi:hypothetical protein
MAVQSLLMGCADRDVAVTVMNRDPPTVEE